MASIGYYDEGGEWFHQCGATLISPNHFLTAAHCLANHTGKKIHVGDFNLTFVKSNAAGIDVEIKEVIKHKKYAGKGSYYDVAIIETDTIKFSDIIKPICLPKESGANREFHKVDLLGWGSNEVNGKVSDALNRAIQVIYPNKHCNDSYTRQGAFGEKVKEVVPDLFQSHVICAGDNVSGERACRGDSGGPLQFYNPFEHSYYQVAIVHGSAGGCGNKEWPTVFVKLDDPVIWNFVTSTISGNTDNQETQEDQTVNTDTIPDSASSQAAIINEDISLLAPVADVSDKDNLGDGHQLIEETDLRQGPSLSPIVQREHDTDENFIQSDWLLIGSESERFEVYNWKTGQSCFVTGGSQGFGSTSTTIKNFKGTPIFCNNSKYTCYKFLTDRNHWVKFSNLFFEISFPAMEVVPGIGLVIFEAHNGVVSTQILEDLDRNWKVGPKITGLWRTDCAVQLNRTVTAIIDSTSIGYYDWPSQQLAIHENVLQSSHLLDKCTVIKDESGNSLVALHGDSPYPHLDILDPANGSIKTVNIPKVDENDGLHGGGGLVSVNHGQDLLLYGGQLLGGLRDLDIVKKLNYASKTWTDAGKMLVERSNPQIVPVHGLKC